MSQSLQEMNQQLDREFQQIDKLMNALVDNDVDFFAAKVLLVNRLKITFGEAERTLEVYERVSRKKLRRE